jgi:hypothetical protein
LIFTVVTTAPPTAHSVVLLAPVIATAILRLVHLAFVKSISDSMAVLTRVAAVFEVRETEAEMLLSYTK